MTTITATRPTTSTGTVAAVGIGSALVAIGCTALGAHHWRELGVVAGVIVLTTAVVFGWVVPRALRKESAGGTALTLAVLGGLLLAPAFWAGIPFVLGAAGLVVGAAGRRGRTGSGTAIAGMVVGALAMVGYVASYVTDAMNGGLGFLFD